MSLNNAINVPSPYDPYERFASDTAKAIARIRDALGPNADPGFGSLTIDDLTVDRLVGADSDKTLVSENLIDYVSGTADEIDVADDAAGGVTIGIVNPLIVAKGGTGVATLTDHGILLGSGTGPVTPLGVASNGQIPIGSAGADPVLATITGTVNQVNVANGAGTITLSTPQDIHTGASPTFAGITAGASTFGDGGTTDYSQFEADGTLEFNGAATVWDDANVGGLALGGPAASLPDEVTFTDENGADTGIYTYGFAVGEKVSGVIEIPHSYKEGSDLSFHVHWQGDAAPTGTDKVKWQLTYVVQANGATLDAATTITIETDIDTQYKLYTSTFAAITGTNFGMGDQVHFTLERIAASADEYGGDAKIKTVGFHFEKDTVGSRQITTK